MKKMMISATMLLFLAAATWAQNATPGVANRQVNQQQRIKEGVKSGELTRREAVRLERQQACVQHQKKAAKADGVVTRKERRQIHRSQNATSRNIAVQKNDAQSR